MMLKSVCALAAMVSFGSAFAATTWYVDDDNYGKQGLDGTTEATAYGTIQDAIDADGTKAGDTILVLPGTYTNGVYTGSYYPVRVHITKPLTIRSTGGRAVTQIVGARNATAGGTAPSSVACILVKVSSGELVVDGFTLRDGGVTTGGYGGGGFDNRATSGNAGNIHLVDCEVSGCYSAGSYVRYAQAHRCFIGVNKSSSTDGQMNGVTADNCIVYGAINGGGGYSGKFINCVVVGNAHKGSSSCDAYNTIYLLNGIGDWNDTPGKAFNGSVTTAKREKFTGEVDDLSLFEVDATSVFVSPAFFDFRLRAESPAVGHGSPAYLRDLVKLPSGYDMRDYAGKLIDVAAATCNPGAIQTPVATPSGLYRFASAAPGALIDGKPVTSERLNFGYATSWPTQWCVTAAAPETEPLSCLANSLSDLQIGLSTYKTYRYAGTDGTIWLMPPPAGTNATITVDVAKDIRYVDPDAGDDAWDGTSATHVEGAKGPWRTLTRAGTNGNYVAGRRVMIRCAAGIYGDEQGVNENSRLGVTKSYLHFVGAPGGGTVIRGKKSENPDRSDGRGPGAVRCVYVLGDRYYTGFTGFTFADGYTEGNGNGGLVYGYQCIVGFTDCVATNIIGGNGLFNQTRVTAERCLLTHSRCNWYGLFYDSDSVTLSGCVFWNVSNIYDSDRSYPWFGKNAHVVHSTFVRGDGTANVVTDGSELIYNCIFADFSGSRDALVSSKAARGCVIDNCSGAKANFTDCVEASARFCDKGAGDFRLTFDSPAWTVPVVEESAAFSAIVSTDFNGRPVCRTGTPVAAGAFTDAPEANAFIVDDPQGCLLADGAAASGYRTLPSGESLTISQNPAFGRPVAGVTVNGETNLFDDATGTLTFTGDAVIARGGVRLAPVLGSTWYVNAGTDNEGWAAGSDANTGFGRWSPKLTLMAGVANAVSNDTVLAAPGRYDQGADTRHGLPCRVFVPNDVVLRAEQGADGTFIVGEGATRDADQYGCGPDATRCAFLGPRSRLVGFTLTGGRSTSDTTSGTYFNDGAAAVSVGGSSDSRPVISDCIVSNNVGSMGILCWINVVRCRVIGNRTLKDMLVRDVSLRDVLFAGNVYATSPVWGMEGKAVENMTWAADNWSPRDGYESKWAGCNANTVFRNCVFANENYLDSAPQVTNCLFVKSGISRQSMVVDPARLHFDADYRPIIDADNALLDAGCNEVRGDAADLDSATDASGRPRVSNGRIDIGALEADWRPRYSKDIGSHVTVTEATSGIVETDGRKVSFGAGGTVSFDWLCEADQKCELSVNVTGDGVLVMTREGEEPVEYATKGTHVYPFKPTATGVQRFTLTYVPAEDDTGTAEILRAKRDIGMVLIFR